MAKILKSQKYVTIVLVVWLSFVLSGCVDTPTAQQPDHAYAPIATPLITANIVTVIPTVTALPIPVPVTPDAQTNLSRYNLSLYLYNYNATMTNLMIGLSSHIVYGNLTFGCGNYLRNVTSKLETKTIKLYDFENVSCTNTGYILFNTTNKTIIIPKTKDVEMFFEIK